MGLAIGKEINLISPLGMEPTLTRVKGGVAIITLKHELEHAYPFRRISSTTEE